MIFIIFPLLQITFSSPTYDCQEVANPSDSQLIQFQFQINNLGLSGPCSITLGISNKLVMKVDSNFSPKITQGQSDLDIIWPITDPQAISLQMKDCSNTYGFTLGYYYKPKVESTYIGQIMINNNLMWSTNFNYPAQQMKDVQFKSESLTTSTNTKLTFSFLIENIQFRPTDYLQIIMPYRDIKQATPSISFFPNLVVKCSGQINGIDQPISCKRENSNVQVTNFNFPSGTLSYAFTLSVTAITPQSLEVTNGIYLGWYQNLISTSFYKAYGSSELTLQMTDVVINKFYLTTQNQFVDQVNIINLIININDFAYQTSTLLLQYPQQMTIQSIAGLYNFNTNPIYTIIEGNKIKFDNQLKSFIYHDFVQLQLTMINPSHASTYSSFKCSFSYQSFSVSQSVEQALQIYPAILQNAKIVPNLKTAGQISDYCLSFSTEQTTQNNYQLKIEFLIDIVLNGPCTLTNFQNINQDATCTYLNQIILINNCFQTNTIRSIIQRGFCIQNIKNPKYTSNLQRQYDIQILYNSQIQAQNQQPTTINYQPGNIVIFKMDSTSQMTQFINNTLKIRFSLTNPLTKNEKLVLTFPQIEYDLAYISRQTTQITFQCYLYVENQPALEVVCHPNENFITVLISQEIKESTQYILEFKGFITSRSVKPLNNYRLQSFYNTMMIDQSVESPIIQMLQVNQFLSLAISSSNQYAGMPTTFTIIFQLPEQSFQQDLLVLELPNYIEAQNLECQIQNYIATQCRILMKKVIMQFNKSINYQEFITLKIKNIINPTSVSKIAPIKLRLLTSDSYDILMSENIDGIELFVNKYEQFQLQSFNKVINEVSNYTLQINNTLQITDKHYLLLQLPLPFRIHNSLQCYYLNGLINIDCSSHVNYPNLEIKFNNLNVQKFQGIQLIILNLINPDKSNQKYTTYLQTIAKETNTIIEKSIYILEQFTCSENCSNCEAQCVQCKANYILFNGTCLNQCPQFYINVNNRCEKCQTQNCEICSSQNTQKCIQCQVGYHAVDNLCQLDQNKTDNSTVTSIPYINELSPNQSKFVFSFQFSYLTFCTIIVIILISLLKLVKRQIEAFYLFCIYLAIMTLLAKIVCLVLFSEQSYFLVQFVLIFMHLKQVAEQAFHLNDQLSIERHYQLIKRKNSIIQLNHYLMTYYDQRFYYLLVSQITESFNFTFTHQKEFEVLFKAGLQQKAFILFPCQIALLIYCCATDLQNMHMFQIEYMLYLLIEEIVLIKQIKKVNNNLKEI